MHHPEYIELDHHLTGLEPNNGIIAINVYNGVEIEHRADGRHYVRHVGFESLSLAKLFVNLEKGAEFN